MNSGLPRDLLLKPVQQRAHHPDGRLCTWNNSRILLVQSQLVTHQISRTWIHLDTPTTRSCAVSVMSSLADSNLQSALAGSQTGITELKDIVVKTFSDDKPDNPRLGFCNFLKVDLVQLTSDSYDMFQQETYAFNLLMRLKRMDKQQSYNTESARAWPRPSRTARPRCHTISLCLTHRYRPHLSRCSRHLHTYHKDFHSSSYRIHSSTFNRHLLSRMHQLNSRSTGNLHSKACSHSNTCK